MNSLASLKLVAAKKPNISATIGRRNKICTKLTDQIKLATAISNGETYAPNKLKTTTDANGNRVQVTQARRIKAWWFSDAGKLYLQVKYGAKVLQLSPKANAIEVADNAALIVALETVKTLVLAGELDAQIEAASGQIRKGFGR